MKSETLQEKIWALVKRQCGEEFTLTTLLTALPEISRNALRAHINSLVEAKRLIVTLESPHEATRWREPVGGRAAPRRPWDPAEPTPLEQAWNRLARLPFLGVPGEYRATGTRLGKPEEPGPAQQPEKPVKRDYFTLVEKLLARMGSA